MSETSEPSSEAPEPPWDKRSAAAPPRQSKSPRHCRHPLGPSCHPNCPGTEGWIPYTPMRLAWMPTANETCGGIYNEPGRRPWDFTWFNQAKEGFNLIQAKNMKNSATKLWKSSNKNNQLTNKNRFFSLYKNKGFIQVDRSKNRTFAKALPWVLCLISCPRENRENPHRYLKISKNDNRKLENKNVTFGESIWIGIS